MTIEMLSISLVQGLILAIISFGMMIPFRFLNFADLTVDGAYPLGGAVCAVLLIYGYNPFLALIIGAVSGGFLAVATAQITLKLRVNSLLAGIIVSTMAYSINLRIMGKP